MALRVYGAWAGNPAGHKEDVSLCIESVHEPGRGGMIHQCARKRGFGKDGLYCKQHDPEKCANARKARADKWDAEYAVKDAERAVMAAAEQVYLSRCGAGWEAEQQRLVVEKLFQAYGKFDAARKRLKELKS